MSLTSGQGEYLLELLSHEYVLTEEQQPVVRQAICQYATTVYDRSELDYLISMPQSPAACLYLQYGKQNFARQYGLWLNCLEHNIFQEIDGLEAILLNPDPTGSEKILAVIRQNTSELTITPLPQLKFSNQKPIAGCSRWTLQEARQSMYQFLQYARCSHNEPPEIETSTWSDLLQQAHLFSIVKENYQFTEYSTGLPKPSNYQQLQQMAVPKRRPQQQKRSWMYQPPANPFAAELKLMQNMKKSISSFHPTDTFHMPPFPAPAQRPAFFTKKRPGRNNR